MSQLLLDAAALYAQLLQGVRSLRGPDTHLVGITSGGAWLAQALHQDLGLPGKHGVISSASSAQTQIPFDVNGADIILLDDVLYTGRTIRAVINELFDFGRPAKVQLAVLVDRGGRQLPIEASFAAARVALPPEQQLALARSGDGKLSFQVHSIDKP
jgi:pyrimidine operon attenuation protein / uracil phosphoribosyltransferase